MIRNARAYSETDLPHFRRKMVKMCAETMVERMERSPDFKDFPNRCLKVAGN